MLKTVGVLWDVTVETIDEDLRITGLKDFKSFYEYKDAWEHAHKLCNKLYDVEAMLEAAKASGDNPKSDCIEDIADDIKADIANHYDNSGEDSWWYPEHGLKISVKCYPVDVEDDE